MAASRPDGARLALGLGCLGALALPFVSVRASRIGAPEPRTLVEILPPGRLLAVLALSAAVLLALVLLRAPWARVLLSLLALAGVLAGIGLAAGPLAAEAGPYARVAPGAGAWTLLALLALFFTEAASRLALGPAARLGLGLVILAGLAALLASDLLAPLSIMVEYRNRAASFRSEAAQHLLLAGGSFAAAMVVGVPLGLLAARRARLAPPLLGALTAIQTVPSMAMFGLMILPLGWLAAHAPPAAALGIRGIGAAPALLALFLYALLPIVGHTREGLRGVPGAILESADAMGLDARQRLWRVEIPLALPVLLTGARIVLVQNIGLATVGALIGAGGFGVFVFQGLGQTAADLVLLGALPPVALAMLAALLMDALIACVPGPAR
ncbi:ABC transporter permease [Amaricoccus solimangrovi]|uniref:ABC transporter permease n=1 Tax=Amaricoccus solimangrovi TaxID=2589815 RepID=A0A501WYN7_9RHOB|nr:ABC transporter permease [Amaricoccus solimangrovi]